ncbi:MAG: neutral zinc metallopeptidase [Pseudomonadota bacterium]|nr:neutral zinc metallopeptidase [Pseudomonadota bacterium]
MRWRGRRESENIEDRRGQGGGFGFPFPGGGGGMRFPTGGGGRGGGGIGIFGILVIVGLMLLFGVDPRVLLDGGSGGGIPDIQIPAPRSDTPSRPMPSPQGRPQAQAPTGTSTDEMKSFISVVLADTEDVWNNMFPRIGEKYREPKLVLFSQATRSACGTGLAQMGPFYCPLDQKVYVDLSFYRELKERFRAPGDFAQAYVIAHEVGHHVQTLLGIAEKVQNAKQRMNERQANALQVRMELQADCLAGVWAHHAQRTKQILEEGDIEEALNAASKIGDDNIQRQTQGRVVPDAFTHGSSEQRVRWFKRGWSSGEMQNCDTFNASSL